MRVLLAVAAGVLWSTAALAVIPNPISDSGSGPGIPNPSALVACEADVFCSSIDNLFIADGEWNPSSNVTGWITYDGFLYITDPVCRLLGSVACAGPYFDLTVPRGFAWDKNAAGGMFWLGTWEVAGANPAAIIHMNADGTEAFVYTYPDPRTGLNIQAAGLAMDYATGQMWGQLRNNPAGTNTGLVVWDTNVPNGTAPVLLNPGGVPWNAPYDAGARSTGASGLEFYQPDCTLIAMHQDTQNIGRAQIFKFQTAGLAAPTYVGHCDLNNIPCQGPGPAVGKPWGITVSEDPDFPPGYVMYSDINGDAACGAINPNDLHIVALPPGTGTCRTTAVEPTTWGQIKDSYK